MMRLRITWSGLAGGPWLSTFYSSSTPSPTSATTFRDAVNAFLNTYRSQMASGCSITSGATVDVMNTDGTLTGTQPITPVALTSNGAGTWLPRECQGLAQLRTGNYAAGREIRGRLYLPQPLTSTADGGGNPNSTFTTLMNTALGTLVGTSGVNLVVWSRKNALAPGVISAAMAPYYAVQRSRRD